MSGKIQNNQTGLVSIMVTMILILVISLIVLGFAQVTRRNQREAVDRELSTQAFYAAETGVNDAVNYLVHHPTYGTVNTDCQSFISHAGLTSTLPNNVSYTCLMVNPDPDRLTVSPLTPGGEGVVWPLKDSNGNNFTSLKFTWTSNSSSGAGTGGGCSQPRGRFVQYSHWNCKFGVMQVDLVQLNDSAIGTDGAGLAQRTVTFYMQPNPGGASYTLSNFSSNANKAITIGGGGACSGNACSVKLLFSGSASSPEYFARISMLPYQSADSVTVTGTDTAGIAHFIGGQAVIDSTGKAQDELRRVQVRVPLTGTANNNPLPGNALESTGSICKLLNVSPDFYENTCP